MNRRLPLVVLALSLAVAPDLVPVAGGTPVPVTRDSTFDGCRMFRPDGKWLAFSSNRGAKPRGETNLFLARGQ